MKLIRSCVIVLLCLFFCLTVRTSSFLPITTDAQIQASAAVFRGTVLSSEAFIGEVDGRIYTRVVIQVNEIFKGRLPARINLVHSGGVVGKRGQTDGASPQFKVGEERLLFVVRRSDGTLFSLQGEASAIKLPNVAARSSSPEFAHGQALLQELRTKTAGGSIAGDDLTEQASNSSTPGEAAFGPVAAAAASSTATNLLVGVGDGLPARFILPDRGEPIPYLIDADNLPAGMSLANAVNAVKNAMAAWTNVSSVRFVFAGFQSFGMAAANVSANDGVLRIQLHDNYKYLNSSTLLGRGGHSWSIATLPSGWTGGGQVIGNDFHKVESGFVVLQHTNSVMQNLATFTEVLCHEIGHSIGLAHSSENQNEPNSTLKQAIMFFQAHGDGRGATLNSFDINVCRQIHPLNNTPPYLYDRYLDVVSSPTRPIGIPGVNSAQLRGYDLQTMNLTLATNNATTNNGAFALINNTVTYVPAGFFSDSPRIDPGSGSYYDIIYARSSDGTNASPYASVIVTSYAADSFNEGIPNSWRTTYFGNANPSIGVNHRAYNDADGDGFNNLQEFLHGSAPNANTSNLRISSTTPSSLQWAAKAYEVYEVLGSTNLTTWTRVGNPVVPQTSIATVTNLGSGFSKQFFRIQRVP